MSLDRRYFLSRLAVILRSCHTAARHTRFCLMIYGYFLTLSDYLEPLHILIIHRTVFIKLWMFPGFTVKKKFIPSVFTSFLLSASRYGYHSVLRSVTGYIINSSFIYSICYTAVFKCRHYLFLRYLHTCSGYLNKCFHLLSVHQKRKIIILFSRFFVLIIGFIGFLHEFQPVLIHFLCRVH